jgi:predicted transcriptional regulator
MLNNITISSIAAIILSVMVGGGIYIWKKNVEDQAVIEYVKAQQEQIIKDQKKAIEELEAENKESNDLIADLKEKQINLNQKLKDLESYLSTHKDDKESSEVLKRTFKELSQ